jgi:hypothetical protein
MTGKATGKGLYFVSLWNAHLGTRQELLVEAPDARSAEDVALDKYHDVHTRVRPWWTHRPPTNPENILVLSEEPDN